MGWLFWPLLAYPTITARSSLGVHHPAQLEMFGTYNRDPLDSESVFQFVGRGHKLGWELRLVDL